MNSFDCFAFFVLLTLTSTDGGDSFSCDGEASKMSFAFRKTVLDEHNDLRTKLARGELLKDEKMRLVNMYKLKYNCTLENLAKEWARHCTYDADKGSEGGANLGLIVQALGLPSLGKVTEDVLQETVNKWFTDGLKLLKQGEWKFFQEIVDMHDRRNPFVVTTDDYKIDVPAVPRFFQAAFSKLTQMGCAIKLCPKGELTPISKFYKKDMAILVCRYSGPMISGDSRVIVGEPVRNEQLFQDGTPCVYDSQCTTYPNSTCSSFEFLCCDDLRCSSYEDRVEPLYDHPLEGASPDGGTVEMLSLVALAVGVIFNWF